MLRVLAGVSKVLWSYVTDSARVVSPHVSLSLLTAIAVALLTVGLLSIATGGLPQLVRIPLYLVTALVCLLFGIAFDVTVDIQLYRLSNCLMALRVPRYREQLLHSDEQVRLKAAKQLVSLGWRAGPARPELLAAFPDESAEVRAAVASAVLVAIPDPPDDDEAVPKAARLLLTDSALPVRVYAAAILVASRTPAAELLPVFIDGLKCEDVNVSGLACRALGQIGPTRSRHPAAAQDGVHSRNWSIRGGRCIQKIGVSAIPVLIEVLDRGNSTIVASRQALGDMGEPARTALPAASQTRHQRITLVSEDGQKGHQETRRRHRLIAAKGAKEHGVAIPRSRFVTGVEWNRLGTGPPTRL